MDKKTLDRLSADHERWDNKELGASYAFTAVLSEAEEKDIEAGLGLQMISLRLGRSLIGQFKELAKLEGLGYQPLMRQALAEYAKENEYKLDLSLSAAKGSQRADKLFAIALRLREAMVHFVPFSRDRVCVETDYSATLGRAQALFCQISDSCDDPVLKQHAKLRVRQIRELCGQELQTAHEKKPPRLKANMKQAGKKTEATKPRRKQVV
jgi:hypothetical protein